MSSIDCTWDKKGISIFGTNLNRSMVWKFREIFRTVSTKTTARTPSRQGAKMTKDVNRMNSSWSLLRWALRLRRCSMTAAVLLAAALNFCQAQVRSFEVRVIAPSSTPDGSVLFIAGSTIDLGNWDPGSVRMKKVNDSVWTFVGRAKDEEVIEFKVTRGSWATEALYVDGSIPPNTVIKVVSDTTVTLRPVTWNDVSPARLRIASTSGVTGHVEYHRGLEAEGLKYARDVVVWLPPSYETAREKRYPVLYMHDGQNVFDPKTSFLGYDWRADEVADSLIKAKAMEEIIIVGVNNSPDRIAEYSDTPLGRAYAGFVVNRLRPMIDSLYRTKPSAEHTAVMGSSMGGLISLYFLAWHPDVFSKAGCLSTAIGRARDDEFRKFMTTSTHQKPRIYLDVGELEPSLVPGNRALASFLEKEGFALGKNLEFFYAVGAQHNEPAWAARLWRPLVFLFGL